MPVDSTRYHGGNVYQAARGSGLSASDFMDFSANINPMGLSPRVRTALIESIEAVTCYPDPCAFALKQAISSIYLEPMESIETGNGAVELIYLLCRVHSPRRIILPAPTFGEYEAAARAAGVPVEKVFLSERDGFTPDIEQLCQLLRPADLLFFCNPNNPTGVVTSRRQLEPLAEKAAIIGAQIVVDESFIDFRPPDKDESCRSLVEKCGSVTVLHSLTKFLAVPGLRLGFLVGRPELVRRMALLRDPWNVNVMAQVAGVAGLLDGKYRIATQEMISREKDLLWAGLSNIAGIKVFPPSVNFALLDLSKTGLNAAGLQEKLWEKRVLIRNCASFAGLSDRYVRLAVKTSAENRYIIGMINSILSGEDVE
jgi:threonine-phosphate decarboxylase